MQSEAHRSLEEVVTGLILVVIRVTYKVHDALSRLYVLIYIMTGRGGGNYQHTE